MHFRYATTAYDAETKIPVIGFDMGGTSTDVCSSIVVMVVLAMVVVATIIVEIVVVIVEVIVVVVVVSLLVECFSISPLFLYTTNTIDI